VTEASRTGAEAFCDALEREGVDCVFGLPGTQTVEIYEALRRSRIRSIVPTHELAAAFMANGYARASGRPGVLLTISGPGVAFAPPGLVEAKLDAVPLVHFTIAPATGPTGEPAFQAFDQAAFARPIVKAVLRADHRGQITGVVRQAFALATAPEPGPVFVEFASRALRDRGTDYAAGPPATDGGGRSIAEPVAESEQPSLEAIVEALSAATRPVFFVACDCSDAAELLAGVATDARIPVLVPAPYRGVVPEDHAWTLVCDDQRTPFARIQEVIASADLVVALGTRFTHVATAGFRLALDPARVVCVSDAGAAALPHGYSARAVVRCAPAQFLEKVSIAAARSASTWSPQEVAQWQERFASEKPADPEPLVNGGAPAAFFAALRATLPRDTILITDSGLHQALTRRHYSVLCPGGLVMPSEFQSMGFGLAAGIGAKLADATRVVVVVMGDGGFGMSGLDLLTAARDGIPVIVVVFNDGQLNLIRLQQLREFGRAHGVDLLVPDFEGFAQAVGARYCAASEDLPHALRDALSASAPTLIEVRVGDSRAITGVRAKSLAREAVRHAIGQRAVSWLKRRLD
jgi:acetolactate synthase-1/2/3 large subunit